MSAREARLGRQEFLRLATWFEGGLVVIAGLLAWMFEAPYPWELVHPSLTALWYGLLGTVPLYCAFLISYRNSASPLRRIKRFLIEHLGGFLNSCSPSDLIYLGVLAGVTEEFLFRGVLQPLLEDFGGSTVGLLGSNLLFAMAHFITPTYATLAGLTGLYLGVALDFGGERNLLTPIVIHSVYDILAFFAVVSSYRSERGVSF